MNRTGWPISTGLGGRIRRNTQRKALRDACSELRLFQAGVPRRHRRLLERPRGLQLAGLWPVVVFRQRRRGDEKNRKLQCKPRLGGFRPGLWGHTMNGCRWSPQISAVRAQTVSPTSGSVEEVTLKPRSLDRNRGRAATWPSATLASSWELLAQAGRRPRLSRRRRA